MKLFVSKQRRASTASCLWAVFQNCDMHDQAALRLFQGPKKKKKHAGNGILGTRAVVTGVPKKKKNIEASRLRPPARASNWIWRAKKMAQSTTKYDGSSSGSCTAKVHITSISGLRSPHWASRRLFTQYSLAAPWLQFLRS